MQKPYGTGNTKMAGNQRFDVYGKRTATFLLTAGLTGLLSFQGQGTPHSLNHSSNPVKNTTHRIPLDTFPDLHDQKIMGIDFYKSTLTSYGQGSDQWPLTWGKDGDIYSAWGDGKGWIKLKDESKGFIGVTRIKGTPPAVKGIDLWQEDSVNRKPLALVAFDRKIFLFYDQKKDSWDGSYVALSEDEGHTWQFNDTEPVFSLSQNGLKVVGIAQFGPGYTGVPENIDKNFLYFYLSGRTDGKKNDGKDIWLARVRPEQMVEPEAYEFFAGVHNGYPLWSYKESDKIAVLHDDHGMGYHVSVSFNKPLQRFLLAKSSQISHLGIWEGASPWGPWINIYNKKFLDDHWKFTYMISPKWISTDGRVLWMTFSGWPEEDRINFIRAELLLKEN